MDLRADTAGTAGTADTVLGLDIVALRSLVREHGHPGIADIVGELTKLEVVDMAAVEVVVA